jgi:hypothetical protein
MPRFRFGCVHVLRGLAAAVLISVAGPGAAETLETPKFLVQIDVTCGEGVVSCSKVCYTVTDRETARTKKVIGRTVPSRCLGDNSPCSRLGYEFDHEGLGYYITRDGALVVSKNGKNVFRDEGTWK